VVEAIMEEHLVTAVGYLKLAVEAVGAAIVGFGALATLVILALAVRDKETLLHRDPAVLGPLLSPGVGVPAWF